MTTSQTVRRWILTGAVAAITITGTIYGAQLKGDRELQQQKRQLLEATPEERIEQLEAVRTDLVRQKNAMERKIEVFAERRRAKEEGGTTQK
ncbi:hypothetical protein BDW02DRAFT_495084 [Decorospora gaudefroyi]|uniref:Uncharacterized protein n=1 Tax=Decorospora gaudefroyi TaxID=184978 RepID=A0A6A5KF63_9PLEO|nr:hypothetical protein BDW02DRAFT_495084 [Decorospora gaudefroyi]